MNFFHTFRGRLLFILSILLIATLGVQYFLNLQTEDRNERLREKQTQALVAGIALGFNSMSSSDRLEDFVQREGQETFEERTNNRIKDIIVIDTDWQINDSLNPEYKPYRDENDDLQKRLLKNITDLPPLMESDRLAKTAGISRMPTSLIPKVTARRTRFRLKQIRDAFM